MAFETVALDKINRQFNELGASTPNMYWQYGTLWIETESKGDLNVIKTAMVEDVLDSKYTVQFSEMKPTDREPWTEWAMDVIEKKEVNNVLA
jgi:hypothetical protein